MQELAVRPPDDLRQFSPWFDKGITHFLKSLVTPERMASEYPTRDKHDEEAEADFIAGFDWAMKEHEAAQVGDLIIIDATASWRAEG